MKEAIRTFIIEKAKAVFEAKGYSGTTIEDIAAAAEVSKPTLYNYFSGKDDIFRAAVEAVNTELNELIKPILADDKPFPQRLKQLVSSLLTHVSANRGILKMVVYESRMFIEALEKMDSEGFERLMDGKRERISVMKNFIEIGRQAGSIRDDIPVDMLAYFLGGIIGEYALGHIMIDEKTAAIDLEVYIDSIMTILSKGIFKESTGETS